MILHPLYWLGIKFSSKFLLNLLEWKKNKTLLITYLKLNELSFSVMSLVYFYTINTSLKSYKKDFIFELILWIDVALLRNFKGLQIVTTNRFQLWNSCTQRELPFLLCHNWFFPLSCSRTTAFWKVSEFKCTCGLWNLQFQVGHCKSFIKNQMTHLGSKTKPEKLLNLSSSRVE